MGCARASVVGMGKSTGVRAEVYGHVPAIGSMRFSDEKKQFCFVYMTSAILVHHKHRRTNEYQ